MSTSRREFIAGVMAAGAVMKSGATGAEESDQGRYRKIATEEGFMVPEIGQAFAEWVVSEEAERAGFHAMERNYRDLVPTWTKNSLDLGEGRLQEMDNNGIDMQLLVLSAGAIQWMDAERGTELAAIANDRLAEACRSHPKRFAGLAAIAPQDPEAAAAELERAVHQLDLRGAIINSNVAGEYLDDPKFSPIFEAAVALNVPVYLHPSLPSPSMIAPYMDYALVGPMAGFQAETQVHALRLIMSGLFDRYPDLHMVLGHLGEGIPFFIDRIDRAAENTVNHRVPKLRRKPSEYFLDNFVVTTSGMNSPKAVRYCIDVLGIDRVLFALDYPYETMMPDATALDGLGLPEEDMAKLFYRNAERVFSL